MNIEWSKGCNHLYLDGRWMGAVLRTNYDKYHIGCMWMRDPDDDRVENGTMYPTGYPEGAQFDTVEEARAVLLECATVVFVGGWRPL
jgi:hypothetical protein